MTQMREEIKMCPKEHEKWEVDLVTVWDALKVDVWGEIISFCAHKRRGEQFKLMDLNKELKDFEWQHKREQSLNYLIKKKKKINV